MTKPAIRSKISVLDMIKKLLNGKSQTITSAALLIGLAGFLSRILGIFRDRILAGQFGAGSELDMYYAAFRIPDLVYNLLVLGALSAGFIPVIIEVLHGKQDAEKEEIDNEDVLDKKSAWDLTNGILNLITIGTVIICGLLAIFAVPLTKLITPGFSQEQIMLTANLSRIMFLSPLFLGISSVLGGILQSFKRFLIYSLAPIFYNLGIIIGALFFIDYWGIYGLAIGVILGAFLHMLVQVPTAWMLGFRYKLKLSFDHAVRKIVRLMVPRTLSLIIAQINLVVITIIASTLAEGSLSVFNFANNLQGFPIGIFGVSFALAAFPTLSALAARKDTAEFVKNLSNTIRQILFFIIPATILIILLRAQIVRVVLGTGQFDWNDTVMTMQTLGFLAVSLFAQSLIPLVIRGFYAFHDSFTPFLAGLISALSNVALSIYLGNTMGVMGLGLAFSLSSIINLILLWVSLRIKIGSLDEKRIVFSVFKMCVAGVFLAVSAQGMKPLVASFFGTETFIGIFLQGTIAGLFGLLFYFIICYLLKSTEMIVFWQGIRRRMPWLKLWPHGEDMRRFE